jgi:PAS domain S-box-containing protein
LWGTTLDKLSGYNILEDQQLEAKGIAPFIRRGFAGEVVEVPPILYDPEETIPGVSGNADPRRYVSAVIYPVKDQEGRVREVVLMHQDITERKRAEEALRASEERFRRIFQTVGVSLWEEDFTEAVREVEALRTSGVADVAAYLKEHPEFTARVVELVRVRDVNDASVRLFGARSKDELMGSLGRIFLPETLEVFAGELVALAEGRIRSEAETVLRSLGGERMDVILTLTLPPAGGFQSVLVSIVDITAHKRAERALRLSEERFRSLIEQASDAIFIADTEGRYIEVNTSACRMLGYEHEELTKMRVTNLIPPEHHARLEAVRLELLRGGTSVAEWPLRRRDGELVPVEISTHILPDGRWQAIARDISERKEAEEERERLLRREKTLREQAEEANRLKDEFLATLSHELRTPLTSVLGWAKLLRAERFDAKLQERALEAIERNAEAQTRLINDLLDVSRIVTGKLRLNIAPIELASVIQAAADSVRPAAEARGVRLGLHLCEGSAEVAGDADRLQQVVWNLISNAVKFTPGGGSVEVSLARVNGEAEIKVADTGAGIAPEFLPYVFERFRQADGAITREHGGLGLGLAIARHLVELHGGTIRAESAGKGSGSTFTVWLPLSKRITESIPTRAAAPPQASSTAEEGAPSHPARRPAPLSGLNLLLVEDDEDSLTFLSAVLEGAGARVSHARSAAEAFEKLKLLRPDVLISDIGMAGEDGYHLLRRVRALAPGEGGRTPAAALTAYARPEDRAEALRAGYQLHLPKPVEPATLIEQVARLAGRPDGGGSAGPLARDNHFGG